jgi:DNA-binding NtrC family response regulator
LQNAIEHACAFCPGPTIQRRDLPPSLAAGGDAQAPSSLGNIVSLQEAERVLIARALEAAGGNQARAARLLNVERHRLRRKIRLHGLETLIQRR